MQLLKHRNDARILDDLISFLYLQYGVFLRASVAINPAFSVELDFRNL